MTGVQTCALPISLGTTLFDDKVDTAFTWVFKKAPDTNKVTKSYMMNVTQWKVIDEKLGNIGPYFEMSQTGNGQSFSDNMVGIYGELNKDLTIPGATISLNGYWNPVGEYLDGHANGSKDNLVAPRNDTSKDSLALCDTSEDADKIPQRDPNLYNQYGASAKYKPEAVKGLSLGLGSDIVTKYAPKYVSKESADGDPRTELDGYAVRSISLTKFRIGYKINDKLSIANSLREWTGGVYQQGISTAHPDESGSLAPFSSARFENRITLTATLL